VSTVLVPFRSGGKSRLPADIRADLALAMLGDVLEAALDHAESVRLVTDDRAAIALAAGLRVEVVEDPRGGQGPAVVAGLAEVDGPCLVVNADVPCVTPVALSRLAGAAPALVRASDDTTNALSLPDRSWFESLYGPGSAHRFAAAGFTSISIPELAFDADTLDDLAQLPLAAGVRTTLVLNQHKLVVARAS
jgi:2-phospho-L-lactate guanylyltransferase (CobY/MobA/RfbA family)